MSDGNYRLILPESRIPHNWYNMAADIPGPLPPVLHPVTHQPVGPADLAPLFPMELIMQEVSRERYIPIPDEIRDIYRLYRPTPWCVPCAWKRPSARRLISITRTNRSVPAAVTSSTPRLPRLTTTRRKAPRASPPRPGQASGAPLCPSPALSSAWTSTCSWSRSATIRNHIAAR